eukprot:8913377-Pyramimonas_sp.AAC.1
MRPSDPSDLGSIQHPVLEVRHNVQGSARNAWIGAGPIGGASGTAPGSRRAPGRGNSAPSSSEAD